MRWWGFCILGPVFFGSIPIWAGNKGVDRNNNCTILLILSQCVHNDSCDWYRPALILEKPAVTTWHLFNDRAALAAPRAVREDRADGSFVLRHPEPLQPYARCIGAWLEHWATTTPEADFLAERDATGAWRKLSYCQVRAQVGRIGQALLGLISPLTVPTTAPTVVLSDNAIDHALLLLASMHVGRPVCTISSAYSLHGRATGDYSKLHGMLDAMQPALIYAADAAVYAAPIRAWAGRLANKVPVVFSQGAAGFDGALRFSDLLQTDETPAVQAAYHTVQPNDVAKYLLTSGSTGLPKAVVNTHRMLTANQQQIAQVWPFLNRHRLVLLDWLP